MSGDRDDRDMGMLEMVDHRLEFGRLAALRDQNRNIAFRGHAEIAVDRFGEMEKHRGCSRRSEGRCDLPRNVTGFAETADDQLALAVANQLDRLLERRAELVGKRI